MISKAKSRETGIDQHKDLIVNLLKTNKKKEIAKRFNVSPSTLDYWLNVWGIKKIKKNNRKTNKLQSCILDKIKN